MTTKFIKNYKNTWTIKNPKINISKSEIRETISEVGKRFGYDYIHGTPADWEFEGPVIPVEIANMEVEEFLNDNFKPMVEAIKNQFQLISGKQVSIRVTTDTKSWKEYNTVEVHYTVVILELKFN